MSVFEQPILSARISILLCGLFLGNLGLLAPGAEAAAEGTLRLHPDNPHYFQWRGAPTALITSAEHYGAVLNLDFDYVKYLDALARDGLNLTRTFTGGAYFEPQGAFKIARNTLAPAPGRFIGPWARSDQPGAADGGNKHDLTRWNDAYFSRFRDFVAQAGKHGVVVEVNLFCPFYKDDQWRLSPFNAANNVNGLGGIARTNVYTLDKHGGLLAVQERMTRKFVEELRGFDNVYYEICNEPYFGGVTLEWQHRIADVIADAQKGHSNKKLIAQNIANKTAKVRDPHAAVSVLNFHYTYPPVAVADNHALGRLIGENETGFRGTRDEVYRVEAWDFILAGGGLFNHLDYSFTAGHEDGAFQYPPTQPGGGSVEFRRQLRVLREFINRFDFVKMKPADELVRAGRSDEVSVRVLAEPGRQYAIYVHNSPPPRWKDKTKLNTGDFRVSLELDAPAGSYHAEWIEPASGKVLLAETKAHAGGSLALNSPRYTQDAALRLMAETPLLKVSENKRFLVREDGRPFFYLGDTAWELFHCLTREEADLYLRTRAEQKFTVIQSVVLAEFDGLRMPNAYGHLPLRSDDPTQPVEEYFQHVDWITRRANELGLWVGMLPTWGDKWNKRWGKGPLIFTPQNARAYGEWLARRYRNAKIIWILGGDRAIESDEQLEIIRAMAAGLRAGDGGAHLITFHPMGGKHSADMVHDEPWLDFNMIQSGHSEKNTASYDKIARDYARKPTKPCMDAEPCYENHPVRRKKEQGWFDEWDARKLCYWALFAGAHGHTYGCHDIWSFHDPGKKRRFVDQRTAWQEAIHLPGANQMRHARALIEAHPFLTRIPDQSVIVGDAGTGADHLQATRDANGSNAMIYSPSGRPFKVRMDKIAGARVKASWFNPREGKMTAVGEFPNSGEREFNPPTSGDNNDWVLVLEANR